MEVISLIITGGAQLSSRGEPPIIQSRRNPPGGYLRYWAKAGLR
jgi:hypothetical protein